MSNVLVIGDTHLPFEHKHYLEFCVETKKKYKCNTIVHIGDLVDNHSISYHEHSPELWNPLGEMEETDKHLKLWFKAFPFLFLTRGNHDQLCDRKAKTIGLPKRCFKPYREIWKLPKGWLDEFEFKIDDVLYKHGTGLSGRNAHIRAAERARMNTVMGHTHSVLGIEWLVSERDRIFGMNVGCGINRKSRAFAYGKDDINKPVLGVGVVLDNGENAFPVPMKI